MPSTRNTSWTMQRGRELEACLSVLPRPKAMPAAALGGGPWGLTFAALLPCLDWKQFDNALDCKVGEGEDAFIVGAGTKAKRPTKAH
jgi:hypothetical protein